MSGVSFVIHFFELLFGRCDLDFEVPAEAQIVHFQLSFCVSSASAGNFEHLQWHHFSQEGQRI